MLPSVDELLAAPNVESATPARDGVAQPSPARAEPHDETTWLPLPEVEELPPIHELLEPSSDTEVPAARDIAVAPSPARAEPHDATAWLPVPEGDSLPEIDELVDSDASAAAPARWSTRRWQRTRRALRPLLVGILVLATMVGGFLAIPKLFDAGDDVRLEVDGKVISAETGVSDVASFLKEHHVDLGAHDRVVPGPGTSIENEMTVRVYRAFPVSLDFDGRKSTVYTTFTDPNDFLSSLKLGKRVILRDPPKRMERSSAIVARTRRLLTLIVDGSSANHVSPSLTARELLAEYSVVLGPQDYTDPPIDSVLPDNGSVRVTRMGNDLLTVAEQYTVPDQEADDPNLPVGETRLQEAVPGMQNVTYRRTIRDGQVIGQEPVSKVPIAGQEAKPHILFHGAKYDARWDKIAQCETGGNWSFHGSQYSGGLGIYHGTWNGFGGRQFASTPDGATKLQQIEVAERIRKKHGFGAWGCGRKLGYG